MQKNDLLSLTDDNIHQAVKAFFSTISIEHLYEVGKEQLAKKNASRFQGKRAFNTLLKAQAKRRKAKKTPYFPESIKL